MIYPIQSLISRHFANEFNRRQAEQEMQQIMVIAKEMFGNDFTIKEE